MVVALAGAVYRFDTYLVAFNPGPGWHYFPSVPEMFISFGLIAIEPCRFQQPLGRQTPLAPGPRAADRVARGEQKRQHLTAE